MAHDGGPAGTALGADQLQTQHRPIMTLLNVLTTSQLTGQPAGNAATQMMSVKHNKQSNASLDVFRGVSEGTNKE